MSLSGHLEGEPSGLGLLPAYARGLLAYHHAHENTLKAMLDTLPLRSGDRILDLATGDGTYAMLLAERGLEVTGVDQDEHYLAFAQKRCHDRGLAVRFLRGDALALPFDEGELDAAFCAQSFYDLGHVPLVVREMRRVVRPGGWVGIMENDTMHHLVLPWPAELELSIRKAELEALSRKSGDESRFYVGRRLPSLFEQGEFTGIRDESFSTPMSAPLSPESRAYLEQELMALFELVKDHLAPVDRSRLQGLCSPSSPAFLLDQAGFSATVLDFLVWAYRA